jgi:hypothetical protein
MREDSDHTEREIKFQPPTHDEAVLRHVRALMPDSWRLLHSVRSFLDLYLDGPGMPLARAGAAVRLRRRRLNRGWTVNFKAPAAVHGDGSVHVARREVRTSVSGEEALLYRTTGIPGLAASLAHDAIRAASDGECCAAGACRLDPLVVLVSARRTYTVSPPSEEEWPPVLVTVLFEDVTAIDVREADHDQFIRSGFLDVRAALPTRTFPTAEIEADGVALNMEHEATRLMEELGRRLAAGGLPVLAGSKYLHAASLLGMRAG